MDTKKFTRLSLLLGLSVVLNIIESFIPIFNGYIPGIKIGLANTVTLFVLYKYNLKDALYISILRVILVGITRTGSFSTIFMFSLSGAILSTLFMYLSKRYLKLSVIGTSIVGSLFHSIGQIIMAMLIMNTTNMIYYFPWILLFALPSGLFIGIISKKLIDNESINQNV